MYGFIYITTNLVNGKRYLGMCSYHKRNWRQYLGSGTYLKMAVKKYGANKFSREIISRHRTNETLSKAEIKAIAKLNCVKSTEWYNVAPGGYITNGFKGRKHTKERNEAIAAKLRGRKRPKHVGEAVSKARRGTVRSPETRRKHSLSIQGAKHPRAIAVTIDGVRYDTITEATKKTDYSYREVRRRAHLKATRAV